MGMGGYLLSHPFQRVSISDVFRVGISKGGWVCSGVGLYPLPIQQDTVSKRAVHNLLECFLVWHNFFEKLHGNGKKLD